MKCTVFLLLAGLCLAVATENGGVSLQSPSLEVVSIEYTPQDFADEAGGLEDFSIFGPLYFTLKASLRTLKGVNCTIKRVIDIRNTCFKFLVDVTSCGVTVTKQLQSVINSVKAVISTCNDIIHLNSNVCNNGDLDNETDGSKKTPFKCFLKLLHKMITLRKQISKTITLTKKVPQVPGQVGACLSDATNQLTSFFLQFPSFVKTCSRLKS